MTETIENVHTPARHDTTPLLSVRDLRVTFQRSGEKPFVAVDGVSFDVRPGADRRAGRRVRLRQVGHLAGDHGPAARRGVTVEGEVSFEGTNLLAQPDGEDARPPRPRHRHDLPGPAVVAEPGRPDRDPGHRGARAAPRPVAQGGHAGRPGPARPGRHPRPGPAAEGLPAPAVRRHAPAGADRDGAGLPAPAADRRRADHRARRDHPGADPRAAQGAGRRTPAPRWS